MCRYPKQQGYLACVDDGNMTFTQTWPRYV